MRLRLLVGRAVTLHANAETERWLWSSQGGQVAVVDRVAGGAPQGVDTFAPTITLADGTVADGCYEDTIGTCLLLEEAQNRSGIGGGGGGSSGELKFLCQTEKLLFAQLQNQRKLPNRTTLQHF